MTNDPQRTTTPFWRRLPILLVAAVFVLGAAACGDDDDDDDAGDGGGDSAAAELTIEGTAFPATLEVASGATVTVVNEDALPHTVTSEDGGFDVEVPESETTEFDAPTEPGDYDVVCEIHPSMTMTLTVTE
jgi:plastocyanin